MTAADAPVPGPARSWGLFALSPLFGAGLLALAVTLAYFPSLHAPFLFDDTASITRNTSIRHLSALGDVLAPPSGGEGVTGRPIVNLSLAINYAIGGTDVLGYHLFNLVVHLFATLALFGLLRRTFKLPRLARCFGEFGSAMAFLIAALWALHPLQTESVTCVIQRTESLAGLFFFLTFYGFVRSLDPLASKRWYAVTVGACLVGMATKEIMVMAPILVVIFDRTFISGTFGAALKRRPGFYSALAGTWLLLLVLVVSMGGSRGAAAGFGLGVTWWQYALKQAEAIIRYLGLSLWPSPLVLDYGVEVISDPGRVLPQLLVLAVLISATLVAHWRRWSLGFLGLWFFGILAPSSSVLPLVSQTVAEHRMYLPLAAVCVLLATVLYRVFGRLALPVLVSLAVGSGWLTVARNMCYRDDLRIWADTVRKVPNNPRAQTDFGNTLLERERVPEAIARYETALRLDPNSADAHANLASALLRQDRFAEARQQCEIALRLSPDDATAHNNLANACARLGQPREAVEHAMAALRLRTEFPEAHTNLGLGLMGLGRTAEAIQQFQLALQLRPDSPDVHFGLGGAFLQEGSLDKAAREFETALQLRKNYAEAEDALGTVLLRQGRLPEAMAHYESALRLKPNLPSVRSNLGAAYFQAGDMDSAAREFLAALAANPNDVNAHANLASVYLTKGQLDEAINQYEMALRLKADYVDAHRNLALALLRRGRRDNALVHLQTAVGLQPGTVELRSLLASVLSEAGRIDEAISQYRAAVEIAPKRADVRCDLGIALLTAGQAAEGATELQAALKLQPNLERAREALARTPGRNR